MPKWEDYKAEASARGSLAHEVYAVVSTPSDGMEAVKANLPGHLEYIQGLERAGTLFLAGPLSDESGEEMQGTGMLILRAASLADARAVAEGDPMHTSGARTFTLRRWMINEGTVTVNVSLASQSVSLG